MVLKKFNFLKHIHKYKEQTDGSQRGGVRRLGEKGKEIKKYKLVVKVQHREYS